MFYLGRRVLTFPTPKASDNDEDVEAEDGEDDIGRMEGGDIMISAKEDTDKDGDNSKEAAT